MTASAVSSANAVSRRGFLASPAGMSGASNPPYANISSRMACVHSRRRHLLRSQEPPSTCGRPSTTSSASGSSFAIVKASTVQVACRTPTTLMAAITPTTAAITAARG